MIADLRASQRFVQFLSLIWQQAIYKDSTLPDGNSPLFSPRDFFPLYVEEAQAFDHYMADEA